MLKRAPKYSSWSCFQSHILSNICQRPRPPIIPCFKEPACCDTDLLELYGVCRGQFRVKSLLPAWRMDFSGLANWENKCEGVGLHRAENPDRHDGRTGSLSPEKCWNCGSLCLDVTFKVFSSRMRWCLIRYTLWLKTAFILENLSCD